VNARNRIRCTVVAVAVSDDPWISRGALGKEIMPGADPYVAQLIQKLQTEVREERRLRALLRHDRSEFESGDGLDKFAGHWDQN
jgi:hypothetical protein